MLSRFGGNPPKFYGSVTVGERGQVAIPAEARRNLDITPTTKLLVFGGPDNNALMLIKAESITAFIANGTAMLAHFEHMLKTDAIEPNQANR